MLTIITPLYCYHYSEREREIAMKVENKMKAAQERRKEIMREFWARAAEQEGILLFSWVSPIK